MNDDYSLIYDGSNLEQWRQIGPGHFVLESDGSIRSAGGMGLLWYPKETFSDFSLRLEWRSEKPESNSGVFVRFPEPRDDPWNPVREGHEIQICDTPEEPKYRTGAVYDFAGSTHVPTRAPGEWNEMAIQVIGPHYVVAINGETVCRFDSDRSLEGYVGLQNHSEGDTVWFRNVRVKKL